MMDVKAGTYTGKINEYALTETKNGDMQVAVNFTFEQEGENKNLTWFGSFKEGKAREITLETLKKMGFRKTSLETLAMGVESAVLNLDQEYSLKVELDSFDGKTIPKIRWVNLPGEGSFANKLTSAEVLEKQRGMNLNGDLLKFFGGENNSTTQQNDFNTNDLPF